MSIDAALHISAGRRLQSGGCHTEGSVPKSLQAGVGGGEQTKTGDSRTSYRGGADLIGTCGR